MSAGTESKTVLQSRTTQNVAAATVTTGGTVAGVIAGARAVFPDLIPWNESADVSVAVVITTVIAPLVSRLIAFWRTPEKKATTTE